VIPPATRIVASGETPSITPPILIAASETEAMIMMLKKAPR
jgi:hypothetical protein